jgi:hypothetical protein
VADEKVRLCSKLLKGRRLLSASASVETPRSNESAVLQLLEERHVLTDGDSVDDLQTESPSAPNFTSEISHRLETGDA